MKKQLTTIAMALLTLTVVAQEENQFTVDAQLRTRGEYNNGAGTPRNEGQLPATFINNRARLSFGYQRGDNLELKFSAQHTGIWGQDDMNAKDGQASINEAWAKLKFGDGFFAQIGRQQLVYDDERILEVHAHAVAVGQSSLVHHLQQDVEHVGVSLLNLVE